MTAATVADTTRHTEVEVGRVRRNAVIGLAGAAANGLLGFILTVVLVRSFGAAGSGALFTAIAVTAIAGAICCAGADTGLLYALPRQLSRAGRAPLLTVALVPTLVGATAVAVAGVLGADRLAPLLLHRGGEGAALLRIAAVTVPVTMAMTVLLAAVRALRPVGAYVVVQSVLVAGARPLLVGLVAGMGTTLAFVAWSVPLGVAVVVAVAMLVGPLGLRARSRLVQLRPAAGQWWAFWRFALPRGASAAIDASSMWIGVVLTAALAGAVQAGIFSAVGRYVLAGLLIMQGMRVAVAPQLSRLLGGGRVASAAAVYRRATAWIIAVSWPAYLVLGTFAPAFLSLFGRQFVAGAPAMAVLCAAMTINCGVGNAQTVLLMSGNSRRHLAATAAGLVINVTLCLVLIPAHGAFGAAIGWAAGVLVENGIAAVAARAVLDGRLVDSTTIRAAVGGLAVAALPVLAGLLVAGRGVGGLAVTTILFASAGAALFSLRRVRTALRTLPSLLAKDRP